MKSVKDLFSSYSFLDAKTDLLQLIENSFDQKKESVVIPGLIIKCFSYHVEETKKLFLEMEEKGYEIKFKKDQVVISLVKVDHFELVRKLLKEGVNRLLDDKNLIELILELIKSKPHCWRAPSEYNGRKSYSFEPESRSGDNLYIRFDLGHLIIDREHKISINDKQMFLLQEALNNKDVKSIHDTVQVGKRGAKKEISMEDFFNQMVCEALSKESKQ